MHTIQKIAPDLLAFAQLTDSKWGKGRERVDTGGRVRACRRDGNGSAMLLAEKTGAGVPRIGGNFHITLFVAVELYLLPFLL